SAKACGPDLEFSADEPHEFRPFNKEVAATVLKLEAASVEEDGVHERDLADALLALVETAFAGCVAVTLQALACEGFHFCDLLHRSTGDRTDADCFDCSVHVLVLSFLKILP